MSLKVPGKTPTDHGKPSFFESFRHFMAGQLAHPHNVVPLQNLAGLMIRADESLVSLSKAVLNPCENHHSVLRFQRLWWRWWWVPDAKLESQSSTMLSPGSLIISCFPNAERGPGYGKDGKDGGKSKVLCHPVLPTDFSSRSLILLQLFH